MVKTVLSKSQQAENPCKTGIRQTQRGVEHGARRVRCLPAVVDPVAVETLHVFGQISNLARGWLVENKTLASMLGRVADEQNHSHALVRWLTLMFVPACHESGSGS